jgi:hypothetical protein
MYEKHINTCKSFGEWIRNGALKQMAACLARVFRQ